MFAHTENPAIFAVSGLSTDADFIKSVGDAIHVGTPGVEKPASLKYVHFSDGVVKAVIKGYGEAKGGYILRDPRGPNAPRKAGVSGKHSDPYAEMARIEAEARAKKEAVVTGLEAKLTKLATAFDTAKAKLEEQYNADCAALGAQISKLRQELSIEAAVTSAFEGNSQDESAAA